MTDPQESFWEGACLVLEGQQHAIAVGDQVVVVRVKDGAAEMRFLADGKVDKAGLGFRESKRDA